LNDNPAETIGSSGTKVPDGSASFRMIALPEVAKHRNIRNAVSIDLPVSFPSRIAGD